MKSLVITIPVYNEQEHIRDVVLGIPKDIEGIHRCRVIIIDDGSTDNTIQSLQGLDVEIIHHPTNLGLGRSFCDGLKRAIDLGADIMVNIDGDGQFDPREIPRLIQPILHGEADFVSGSRFLEKRAIPHMPKIKYFGNWCVSKIISKICGKSFTDVSCGFRAYSREAMLRLNLFGSFTCSQETFLDLSAKGMRIVEVPVSVRYFAHRKSRLASNIFRYGWQVFKIIFRTTRDYRPLKVIGGMGVGIFLVGVFFDALLFGYYIFHHTFSPYKFFGFVGGLFNILGIVVFFLGMVADMLYRIRMILEEILYRIKHLENNQRRNEERN